ncbi:MAG TPA: hypothetical protein VMW43_03385 [Bacteroidota bacterium]|nr:hypothetical protein [Bacteroidota bacterium]
MPHSKNRFVLIAVALGLLFPVVHRTLLSQSLDDTVKSVAREGVQAYLQKIRPGSEMRYGFTDRAEFRSVAVGSPMRIYSIPTDSLREEIRSDRRYLIDMGEWKVPVMIGDETRAMLTVAKVGGSLKVVELSGAQLAHEIDEFSRRHPAERKGFLRLYQAHCDFLILTGTGGTAERGDLYPLGSAMTSFSRQHLQDGKPYSFRALLPVIRQKYRDDHLFHGKTDR